VLVGATLIFGLVNGRFLAPNNLSLITQQVAVVGSLSVGQTLIILTGGVDLSVGSAMVFTSMVMANSVLALGLPGWLALGMGLVLGCLAGATNGLLVTRLRLPPFIVTLGTWHVFTALTLLVSSGQTVQEKDIPDILLWTGGTLTLGSLRITTGVLLMVALYALLTFVLRNTAWGRHVYAVGNDAEASRLAGISVDRLLLSVYAVAGLIFGLTAWVLIGRVGAASPNAAVDA